MEGERLSGELEKLTITPNGQTIMNEGEQEEVVGKVPKVEWAKYSKRVVVKKILGRGDGGQGLCGEKVVVGGWVKSGREQGKTSFAFLEVNDSSCSPNVQARIPLCLRSLMRLVVGNQPQPTNPPSKNGNTNGGHVKPVEATPGRTIASIAYIQLNDGSYTSSLQVVIDSSVITPLSQVTAAGTCLLVQGVLRKPSQGSSSKHKVELKVEKILQLGAVDTSNYPISKTRLPLDFLRNYVHLRPRTNTFSAVARIRNALAYATHTFFQNHGFLYVHTPVITTSPVATGADTFQVTTLFSEADRVEREMKATMNPTQSEIEEARNALKEKAEKIMQLRRTNSNRGIVETAIEDLEKTKQMLSKMEESLRMHGGIPRNEKDGSVDYSKDYFSRQAYLSVTGQFHAESYASALSSVYTFGPTFRAESNPNSTNKTLSEYWMVEPEMAFAELEDDMNCAEDYLKFLCQWLLDNCMEDMKFMSNQFDKNAIERLKLIVSTSFGRITYSEAIDYLNQAERKFQNTVQPGMELTTEHERYLTEQVFKKPIIVYNYPKEMRSFYVRLNEDDTVSAMDVLVPKIGGIIGGSQREERYEVIESRIQQLGLPREPYEWYLELRKFGTVKHSGFGLAFERMVLFVTGLDNIKDTIPFPRQRGRAHP